jgi:hypothetical protein
LDKSVDRKLAAQAQEIRQRFLYIIELIDKHSLEAVHEPLVKHL